MKVSVLEVSERVKPVMIVDPTRPASLSKQARHIGQFQIRYNGPFLSLACMQSLENQRWIRQASKKCLKSLHFLISQEKKRHRWAALVQSMPKRASKGWNLPYWWLTNFLGNGWIFRTVRCCGVIWTLLSALIDKLCYPWREARYTHLGNKSLGRQLEVDVGDGTPWKKRAADVSSVSP